MQKSETKKLELLSPAKDLQTALAAINSGADAIYIGAHSFGARAGASNSIDDIEKIINYAHLFNIKVYVTINTILDDKELIEAKKLIDKLYEIKADAIIVQDFGILYLSLNNELAPIPIHISTQADNRTVEKIKFFENIGAKRVILARELSIDEIQKIHKNTNMELEHFIHGALCVSYSGQCYMSHYIGGRSANRGVCAQACRKKYSLLDDNGHYIFKNQYLLSLKDNNLSNHLDKLIKAGIVSFKIEGRLKDENYVKNITLYYHNLLKKYPRISHGIIISDFTPNPYKTFNRSYSDDYLFNRKDNIYNFITPKSTGEYIGSIISSNNDNFTIKTNLELSSQDGLCYIQNNELAGCLINKCEKIKEGFKVYPNKKLKLLKGTKIYRNIDFEFNKILKNSKTVRKLEINFTVFDSKIEARDKFSNKVELEFEFEAAKNSDSMKNNFIKSLSKTIDTPYLVKNIEFKCKTMPFLAVSEINRLRNELLDLLSKKILSKYKVKKQKPIDIAKFPIDKGDYRLNVHNKKAQEFYELCDCNVLEQSFESQNKHTGKELMRTRHCLKRASVGCRDSRNLFLEDEKGEKYPLIFDCKNCEMAIIANK